MPPIGEGGGAAWASLYIYFLWPNLTRYFLPQSNMISKCLYVAGCSQILVSKIYVQLIEDSFFIDEKSTLVIIFVFRKDFALMMNG
jgi:hypothetical protein